MNYSNYKHKITERFGVELIGWPNDLLPIRNPAQLGGRDQVQKLLSALTTKVCHWKKLSEENMQRRIILITSATLGGNRSTRHARTLCRGPRRVLQPSPLMQVTMATTVMVMMRATAWHNHVNILSFYSMTSN